MDKLSCFTHGTVVCDLESTEKFDAIHELFSRAPVFRDVEEIGCLEEAVVKRERVQSTGFGRGVAVAHGKSPAVGEIVVALGISRRGIPFESVDEEPVQFLFVVANPPGMQLEYLLALSIIVRVIRDERIRSELLSSFDPEDIEMKLNRAFRASMIKRGFPFT